MSMVCDVLLEMFKDRNVVRAQDQRVEWNFIDYRNELKSIETSLWRCIEPTLERLEDGWARDCGISRAEVIESARVISRDTASVVDPLALLATSTIFGYGFEPYGPSRLKKMLETADVAGLCNSIYSAAQTGPQKGFTALFDGKKARINQLAASMGSKYLYFASHGTNGTTRSLINDERVFEAMKTLGIAESADPKGAFTVEYVKAVGWMHAMATEVNSADLSLTVVGADIECALFQYARWKRRLDRLRH